MKRILLLVHASQKRPGHLNWLAFRDVVSAHMPEDIQVEMAALSQLLFVLDGTDTAVRDTAQGFDVADFDLVVFRTVGQRREEAIAVAAYCRKRGVAYVDDYIPRIGDNKLGCAFVRWEHGLRVPSTAYGAIDDVVSAAERFGWPVIAKADNGKKGRDNYLVNDEQSLRTIFAQSRDVRFVVQKFIPNDGDVRLLVLGGEPVLAIKRVATGDSHLNNTSQGGVATNVPIAELGDDAIQMALAACKLEQLFAAGVDILFEKGTELPYMLEVNRAPQIATGAIAEEKVTAYAKALENYVWKAGEHE